MSIEDLLFCIAWLGLPAAWFFFLRVARVDIGKISIPSVLMLFVFITQYVGIPLLYFKLDAYRSQEVSDPMLILKLFGLSSVVITLLIAGFVLARYMLGTNFASSRLTKYHDYTYRSSSLDFAIGFIFSLIGFIVLCAYIRVIGFSNIALANIVGLGSSGESSTLLRSNMGNSFDGRYYLYKFFMRDLLIVGSYIVFISYLGRSSKFRLFTFLISFVICSLSVLMATEKEPFVLYLLGLVFCYLMVRTSGRYFFGKLFPVFVIFAISVPLIYALFMGAGSFLDGLFQAISRVLTGQIQPLYHYLEIFPNQVDYLLGASMPNPRGVFPFDHYNLSVEVMNIVQPWHLDAGVVGTMPTFFWGELYANFGLVGVVLFPSFVGFSVCLFADILDRLRPTPIVVSFVVWLILHIKNLSATAISNYLFDFYLFGILLILVSLLFFLGRGKIHINHSFGSRPAHDL